MTTAAYVVKGDIIDHLAGYTGPGQALDGWQVSYEFPGATITDRCVYGGGVIFDQSGVDDVVDGDDVAAHELDTMWIYIRVVGRGLTVRQADAVATTAGDIIGGLLRTQPRLAGPQTHTRIAGGTGDYQQTDDGPIVILAYRVTTAAYV